MIYKNPPENFNARFEVVSCFVEHEGEILLLHRQNNKTEGDKWGVPAGKKEERETESEAIAREMREETGLDLHSGLFQYFDKVYVRYPDYDFVYHMFTVKLEERPNVLINESEHKNFQWADPQRALELNLIRDEDQCIRLFYRVHGSTA